MRQNRVELEGMKDIKRQFTHSIFFLNKTHCACNFHVRLNRRFLVSQPHLSHLIISFKFQKQSISCKLAFRKLFLIYFRKLIIGNFLSHNHRCYGNVDYGKLRSQGMQEIGVFYFEDKQYMKVPSEFSISRRF